jgi:EAL domain-containing protein (putative c-di-GMP-specific phosphodiesterase class I)
MGVYVSIDDFGIGYSSLGYLKRFPLRVLKIDRSFIQDLPGNTDSEAITTAIIAMAHSLNLEVVAEGVETEDQAALLRGQACDAMQGYLFSRPLSVEALEQMLPRRLELAERVSLPVAA